MLPDSVLQLTTSTGTGTLTLGAVVNGFVAVSARLADQEFDTFLIEEVDANLNPTGAWEICTARYNASGNTISNRTAIRSSNGNNLVNFAAGDKTVTIIEDPRAVRVPTYTVATLPTLPSTVRAIANCSDAAWSEGVGCLVRWDGTQWRDPDNRVATTTPLTPLSARIEAGLLANRPAASDRAGVLWVATDQNNVLYYSNGTSWIEVRNNALPTWGTPTLVSGYTYSLTGQAAGYLLFAGNSLLLLPSEDYTTSGSQLTVTSALVCSMLDSGVTLRAVRVGAAPSLPSGYYLNMPPAVAHPNNLEMGSTAGLTLWTPGNRYTLDVLDVGVAVRCTSAPTGVDWGGAYFALPSGNTWSMFATAGIAPNMPAVATDLRTVNWGIALLQNTSNSSELITLASGWTGGDAANGRNTHVFCTRWTSYTAFSTELGAVYFGAHEEMATYFRITRNGSTYTFWFSRSGLYWSPLYEGTLPWVPAVGAILYCNGANRAGLNSAAHFANVRFTDSAAVNQPYPGRRL